ncbi:aminoglycoside 6-adenylyltransferase [Nocardia beijingensis]|uniref:aminoglycoside 6-adenylyltransferase n=1 Tax=Nocardia beijingensis TaxID=95162 RepID=UPI001894C985|nr:aminoglycoside 6-adenylyltransferase [Nocardia beijingensis]MBF6465930.1 aminoglycoside 6-adenylyltransferase [Nocardia beijingensis]
MEDPGLVIERIVAFAAAQPGISAVIQTGSRARGTRVDAFSDVDIELIGPGTGALVGADDWLRAIGPVLVNIHLDNHAPHWPTCLVVLAEGRKVDFTLAGPSRLARLIADGLDQLYQRGYRVLLDKDGSTTALPPATGSHTPARPSAAEIEAAQREFWFETTQIPIYVARGDLWHAMLRVGELRELLLTMAEWHTTARSGGRIDHWHDGHYLHEWLDSRFRDDPLTFFPHYDAAEILAAVHAMADTFTRMRAEVCREWHCPALDLRDRVLAHLDRIGTARPG